jgi:ribonuclease-3
VLGVAEALVPRACQAGLDYERLETLGDACLKFSASLHLYHAFPAAHEGQLTSRKNRIVSNAALARVGLGLGLQRFIAQPMAAYDWAAGAPAARGSVRTKVLADVVEALAGAFFCGGGGAAAAEALLRRAGALPAAAARRAAGRAGRARRPGRAQDRHAERGGGHAGAPLRAAPAAG